MRRYMNHLPQSLVTVQRGVPGEWIGGGSKCMDGQLNCRCDIGQQFCELQNICSWICRRKWAEEWVRRMCEHGIAEGRTTERCQQRRQGHLGASEKLSEWGGWSACVWEQGRTEARISLACHRHCACSSSQLAMAVLPTIHALWICLRRKVIEVFGCEGEGRCAPPKMFDALKSKP